MAKSKITERTSKRVASTAAKSMKSKSKTTRTLAGSALSQRRKSR